MGVLRATRNDIGGTVVLHHEHFIGRRSSCDLVLATKSVSSAHALIRWDGARWSIRDLGSRNGTFLNSKRSGQVAQIGKGESQALGLHDRIFFSSPRMEWEVVSLDRPEVLLLADTLNTSDNIALDPDAVTAVPSRCDSFWTLFFDRLKETWFVENSEQQTQALRHGDEFTVAGRVYRLHIPRSHETAVPSRSPLVSTLDNISLEIETAANEESAALIIDTPGGKQRSKDRVHFYMLSYLAKRRIDDYEILGRDDRAEAGWVANEELCQALDISSVKRLSVDVFRARKELSAMGIAQAVGLIDRSRKGKLRIGIPAHRLRVRRSR